MSVHILGTLLGDASMQWSCHHGRYTIRHGAVQREYCESKAALLADYVNTPPRIVPNGGWGKELCVFTTVTTPAFDSIRSLCYRPDPWSDNPHRLIRMINQAWLDRLEWEALAYWYLDDGTLARTGNCSIAVFNTHRYPREHVELLTKMFNDRGIAAKTYRVEVRGKECWLIYLTSASTRLFISKIKEFVHPSMAYKTEVFVPTKHCAFCQELITEPIRGPKQKTACCPKPECRLLRDREIKNACSTFIMGIHSRGSPVCRQRSRA